MVDAIHSPALGMARAQLLGPVVSATMERGPAMSLNPHHQILGEAILFQKTSAWKECPYCRSSFKARWFKPTKDQMYGHWQRYCSALCWKLATEEKKEATHE
jgi:hypothetical protein